MAPAAGPDFALHVTRNGEEYEMGTAVLIGLTLLGFAVAIGSFFQS